MNSSELDFQQAMKKNFDRVKRDLPEAGHDFLIQKLPLPQTTLSGLTRRGEDLKPKVSLTPSDLGQKFITNLATIDNLDGAIARSH